MPTIKPGSKDATKVIGAQVNTPRRARKNGKKKEPSTANTAADHRPQTNSRTRSRSRGRKLLDAAVARISIGRSRSKSSTRQPRPSIEISAPIVGTRVLSEVFGTGNLLIQPELEANNRDIFLNQENNNRLSRPVTNSIPFTPEEENRLLMTPQSSESISEDDSLVSSIPDIRPVSNLRSASQPTPCNSKQDTEAKPQQTTILSRLKTCDPNAQVQCDVCSKLITPDDRCEIINQIMHQRCFKCTVCGEGLANQSSVCHNGTWSCASHFQFNVNSIDDLAV